MIFATAAHLQAYVGEAELPAEPDRLLERASELVDEAIAWRASGYWKEPLPDPLTDEQQALRDATCAQIEFWMAWGEEHDIEGVTGGIGLAGLRLERLPGVLARRARRHLRAVGLLSPYVAVRG